MTGPFEIIQVEAFDIVMCILTANNHVGHKDTR